MCTNVATWWQFVLAWVQACLQTGPILALLTGCWPTRLSGCYPSNTHGNGSLLNMDAVKQAQEETTHFLQFYTPELEMCHTEKFPWCFAVWASYHWLRTASGGKKNHYWKYSRCNIMFDACGRIPVVLAKPYHPRHALVCMYGVFKWELTIPGFQASHTWPGSLPTCFEYDPLSKRFGFFWAVAI